MKIRLGLDPMTGPVGRAMRLSFIDGEGGGSASGGSGAEGGSAEGGQGGTDGTPPEGTPSGTEGQQPTNSEGKIEELPDWAQKHIADLRKENGDRRQANKTAVEEAARKAAEDAYKKMGVTLGLVKADEAPDASKVDSALADSQRELAVYRLAPQGVDVQRMLDSRSFMNSLSSIDPTDTAALKTAIDAAVNSNSAFKVTPVVPKSGGDLGGGSGEAAKSKPTSLDSAVAGHYSKS